MQKIQPYGQTVTVNNLGNVAAAPSVQVGNPIGQGLGQIGQAVTQVGGQAAQDTTSEMQLNREAFKIQEQQANEAAKLSAVKSASDLELNMLQSMHERMNLATGPATGFTKQLLSDYETQFQQIKETNTNPEAQKFLDYQHLQQRESLARQGIAFEQQRFVGYKVDQVSGTINNGAKMLLIDPNRFIPEKAKTHAVIDASGLDEPTKIKLKEQADTQYRNSAANSMLDNNPVAFANMINPTIGKLPEGSIQSKVATIAQQGGISALYALSVTGIESGFNTKSKSNTSTASGLVQMTKSTREQFGLPDNATPEQQIQAFTQLTSNNRIQLQSNLGREPTDQELYLAHHFGAGGAAFMLQHPEMSMADAVKQYDPKHADATMKSNSYLANKTVKQVIDINYNKYAAESKKYLDKEQQAIGAHPVIEDMTAQERIQWNSKAQQVIQSRQTQMFNQYDSMAKDQIAMAKDGKVPQQLMQPAQFKSPEEYTTYIKTMKLGADIYSVNPMTPAQEVQLINAYTPRQETGYAGDAKRKEELITAIQTKHAAIQKDSVAWAVKNDPEVQKYAGILQTANTPENLLKYNSALIAAQQKQGVANPRLLSQTQADTYVNQISIAKGIDKVKAIQQLAMQYGKGKDWGLVAAQLQQTQGAPDGITAMLSAANERYAQSAAMVSGQNEDDLAKLIPQGTSRSDVDKEIMKELNPYVQSVGAGQLDSAPVKDLMTSIRKQVYARVAQGANMNKAAEETVSAFTGDLKYKYINNKINGSFGNSSLRVPIKYDADIVDNSTSKIVKNLSINDINLARATPLTDAFSMVSTADGFLNLVKDNAVWQTNAADSSATLYYVGLNNQLTVVHDKNGKPITKSFDELTAGVSQTPNPTNPYLLRSGVK